MSSTANRANSSAITMPKERKKLRDLLRVGVEVMTPVQLCRSQNERETLKLSEDEIGKIQLQLKKAYIKQLFNELPCSSWRKLKPELQHIIELALEYDEYDADSRGFIKPRKPSPTKERRNRRKNHRAILSLTSVSPSDRELLVTRVDQLSPDQLFSALYQRNTLRLTRDKIKKIKLRLRKDFVAEQFDQLPDLSWRQQRSVLMDMLERDKEYCDWLDRQVAPVAV